MPASRNAGRAFFSWRGILATGQQATINLQRAGRTRRGDGLLECRNGWPPGSSRAGPWILPAQGSKGLPRGPSAAHSYRMNNPQEPAAQPLGTLKAKWLFLFGLLTFFGVLDCV